jgi:hypothetical protein
MHIHSAWKGIDGGIRATTGEHNDPENGNNPVLGSAGSTPSIGASTSGASAGTPSIGANAEIDCFATPSSGASTSGASAGTPSIEANAKIDCFAHTSERLQKQMQEMAKELKQVQATQQRDHAQMRSPMFLMKNYGSEVELKQQREKQELSNEAEAPPEASRLRGQGIAGRIARTLNSMKQVIAGKRATAERDSGAQREADSTEKQQIKEQLEQHHEQLMGAEQGSEGAQRHTDGAEPKGHMVPEKEADALTYDDQISEIHTAEHRTATISSTEVVHGQAREPPRQTWRVAAVEGRSRVLVVLVGVLAIVMVAHCVPKAVEGSNWHNAGSLSFLWSWNAVVFLTRMVWISSWLWKQEPILELTWTFEAFVSLWHLSALSTVLDKIAVYGRFLRAKTRVSELESKFCFCKNNKRTIIRYTVPEVKAGDGFVVIQTPFGKIIQIIRDDSQFRVGQEYGGVVRNICSRIRRDGWWFQSVLRSFLRSGIWSAMHRAIYMGCQTVRAHDSAS